MDGKEHYRRYGHKSRARLKKWKKENLEYHKEQQRKYRAENAEKRRTDEKLRRESLKLEILEHYGKKCVCCGESITEFLCIDHIDEGGNKQRKKIGGGTAFQRWIKKNNFPSNFRILCHNCNACVCAHRKCIHKNGVTAPFIERNPRYEYMKQLRRNVRKQVLSQYSITDPPSCACCGEKEFEFLCLDHINGGGKKHRQQVGRGSTFYRWVVDNKYPSGFRVLCYNCNFAIGNGNICPHRLTIP